MPVGKLREFRHRVDDATLDDADRGAIYDLFLIGCCVRFFPCDFGGSPPTLELV